jgi:hypothetical protein
VLWPGNASRFDTKPVSIDGLVFGDKTDRRKQKLGGFHIKPERVLENPQSIESVTGLIRRIRGTA